MKTCCCKKQVLTWYLNFLLSLWNKTVISNSKLEWSLCRRFIYWNFKYNDTKNCLNTTWIMKNWSRSAIFHEMFALDQVSRNGLENAVENLSVLHFLDATVNSPWITYAFRELIILLLGIFHHFLWVCIFRLKLIWKSNIYHCPLLYQLLVCIQNKHLELEECPFRSIALLCSTDK